MSAPPCESEFLHELDVYDISPLNESTREHVDFFEPRQLEKDSYFFQSTPQIDLPQQPNNIYYDVKFQPKEALYNSSNHFVAYGNTYYQTPTGDLINNLNFNNTPNQEWSSYLNTDSLHFPSQAYSMLFDPQLYQALSSNSSNSQLFDHGVNKPVAMQPNSAQHQLHGNLRFNWTVDDNVHPVDPFDHSIRNIDLGFNLDVDFEESQFQRAKIKPARKRTSDISINTSKTFDTDCSSLTASTHNSFSSNSGSEGKASICTLEHLRACDLNTSRDTIAVLGGAGQMMRSNSNFDTSHTPVAHTDMLTESREKIVMKARPTVKRKLLEHAAQPVMFSDNPIAALNARELVSDSSLVSSSSSEESFPIAKKQKIIKESKDKQKRTKWLKKEVDNLWQGIALYGNNWRLIKKKSFPHRTYYQVKDKGRRILSSQGWSSGRTKVTHDGAGEEARTLAEDVLQRGLANTGNDSLESIGSDSDGAKIEDFKAEDLELIAISHLDV